MSFFVSLFRCYKKDLDTIFKEQTFSLRLSGFTFFSMPAPESSSGRLFTIISKKVGNACHRNKLRRRLRFIFFQEKLFQNNKNTILICYPGSAQKTFAELKTIVLKSFSKIK